MVYVLNKNGQPLMPTKNHAKVRIFLKEGKAEVVKRCPFTVRLLYDATNYTQPIALGIDAGSKFIGVSATTDTEEVYAAEVELRNDIVKNLASRRELRRTRRNKLRYRKPRFNNRTKGKGWLAPSIKQKIDCHLKVVEDIHKILPITKIIVEVASFDIQKIKNPNISGTDYQQGDQLGFWNVREYVLFRDDHKCQCCKGKSKDKILNVHHIESRQTGGDAPNNLITLCETCHKGYHNGTIKLPTTIKRGMKFSDAAFMGIMRWTFYNKLKDLYKNVSLTYGYITKNTRISYGLQKSRLIDARCISDNPRAEPLGYYFYQSKIRCHNRQIHKATIFKGGVKRNSQLPYIVNGFRNYDKVKYKGKEYFITSRRKNGSFVISNLQGNKLERSYKKLKFMETNKSYVIERRIDDLPITAIK